MAKEKKKSFWLGIDRIIASSIWWQILIALLLSLALFVIVGWIYSGHHDTKPFGKAFADIVSPVTLRSEAYKSGSQVSVADSTVLASQPDQERNLWGLGLTYLCGSLIFSGLLIATITNALRTRADRFKSGRMKYRFRNHVVIIGYNDLVPGMIQRIWEKDGGEPNRIVIGVNKNVQEIFNQLRNHLEENKKMVAVVYADSNNCCDLEERLRVQHAKEVYIIGDGDDAYRLNSYRKIYDISRAWRPKIIRCIGKCRTMKYTILFCIGKRKYRKVFRYRNMMPECYVQMQYQSTYALFQTYTQNEGMEHFHAFNFHNEWARKMLMCDDKDDKKDKKNKKDNIDTRNGVSITKESNRYVHLVIIGMTEMGKALAREAAFLCHYPNFVTKGIRTKITFIDPNAKEQMTYLKGRYHHLFDLCNDTYREAGGVPSYPLLEKDYLDIEFEFIEANIAEPAMQMELEGWAKDDKQVLTIAACTDMPHRSMAAGLYLPDAVFDRNIPVWVYQPTKGDMAEYLGSSHFENVTTFGMSGKDLDIKNEEGVRQAKRLNHFYCNLKKETVDYSNTEDIDKEWDGCKVFNKWSNLYNVSAIPAKLRSVGDNIEESDVEILAEVEHNRWNVEKLLMGFRPTTEEEHQTIHADPEKKKARKKEFKDKFIHDDIRPYGELDEKTRGIDIRFTREIPNIIKK